MHRRKQTSALFDRAWNDSDAVQQLRQLDKQ